MSTHPRDAAQRSAVRVLSYSEVAAALSIGADTGRPLEALAGAMERKQQAQRSARFADVWSPTNSAAWWTAYDAAQQAQA